MNYLNQTTIIVYKNGDEIAYIGDRLSKSEVNDEVAKDKYTVVDNSDSATDNGINGNGSIGVNEKKTIENVELPESRNFDPNNSSSRFFMGTNIWDDNNWDSSIRANVDSQDDFLSDDLASDNLSLDTLGKAAGNSAKNLVTNKIGAAKDVKRLVSRLSGGSSSPEVPDGTVSDGKFAYLKALKSEKYRNVKLNAVVGGTYNSLANLLGFASGMMVGSLGKSSTSNMLDGITSKFTGGLGIAGLLENVSAGIEAMPTLEEITALNLARFDTMYEARPGRIVRDRYNKYNYITPNLDDGIDGTKSTSSQETVLNKILGKVNGVATKVSNAMNTASSWLNGSKFTEFIASKDLSGNSKTKSNEPLGTIITIQREENFAQYVGSTGSIDKVLLGKEQANKSKQSIRIGLNITDWTGRDYGGKYGILGTSSGVTDMLGNQAYFGDPNETGWSRSDVFSRINDDYRKIGCLYIEPYYNNNVIECFQIPFEFNPTISDGGYEAKYQTQELLGRILSVRSYTGTDSATVSLETTYMALAKERNQEEISNSNGTTDSSMSWMNDWTTEQIEKIEQLYRSLVMPYEDITYGSFVRPPIVRIKLRGYSSTDDSKDTYGMETNDNIEYVGDLFKYPRSILDNNNILYVTKNLEGINTREKRYIVTNLQISPLEDDSLSYQYFTNNTKYSSDNNTDRFYLSNIYSRVWRRYGFKVSLTLAETTRNFLDQPPTFKQYYDANDETYKYNNENHYAYNGSEEENPDFGSFTLDVKITDYENSKIRKDYFDADILDDLEDIEDDSIEISSTNTEEKQLLAVMYNYADWQGEEQES